ncbi:hypothetical protein [uncultured Flavobacterium sp.]|uniref:hypothetical protein n=1 Tax=uncultured Flavobacterium sp. TaxID=165435 RepID=UPI0025929350|nr:hypothetical protein [uncultured Flavobacterium sp.]
MEEDKKPATDIVIFFVSLLVMFFWILTNNINVYENKFIGIIAEILWLPLILLIFVLPIMTFVLISSRKFKKSKILFLSLAIQVTILIIQIAK